MVETLITKILREGNFSASVDIFIKLLVPKNTLPSLHKKFLITQFLQLYRVSSHSYLLNQGPRHPTSINKTLG